MNEIIKQYIGKDCLVFITNQTSVVKGKIIELNENWMTVNTKNGNESINIDYIVRIMEQPVDKKGKKKSIIA